MKILLILMVVWAIALIVRILMRGNASQDRQPTPPTEKPAGTLVICAYCGVHCPADSSFRYQDNAFCSKAHLDQYFQYSDDKPDAR